MEVIFNLHVVCAGRYPSSGLKASIIKASPQNTQKKVPARSRWRAIRQYGNTAQEVEYKSQAAAHSSIMPLDMNCDSDPPHHAHRARTGIGASTGRSLTSAWSRWRLFSTYTSSSIIKASPQNTQKKKGPVAKNLNGLIV